MFIEIYDSTTKTNCLFDLDSIKSVELVYRNEQNHRLEGIKILMRDATEFMITEPTIIKFK